MKIFSHAGFDWVNSLNDRLVYFNYVWPADDDMRFFPKHLKKWEEKYGIQYAYWRPPFNPPRWTDNPVGKEAAAHMGGVNIGRDAWDQFWSEATKKLGFIKVWMPTDEQSYHRGPRESIPYIEIAAKHIRKNIPDAIIMNSSQSFHLYQMLKLKPDLDIGDAIGGSRHGFERNSYFYDRCVKDMTGKEFWSVAVGWIVPSWHQVLNYESMDLHKNYGARFAGRNNTVAASLFNEAAIIGVERFGLYSAKFDKGRDPFSLFTSDGTIKPFGIQFINTINFLRGHKRGGIIDLDSAYGVYCSYLYREGRVCAMLMPDGAYDEVVVNLDMPGDKVQVYDFNLNPITFSKRVVLPPSKCIFVEDRGLGGDKLLAALKALKAYPEGMERRLVLPAGDGVELAAYKMQKGKMTRLAATALPKDAGLKYPIDQARYGRNQAWATVAPRRRVGRELGHKDFQGSAPSFIYCWHALDGSSGALQGIRNFGSVFSLSDISATFKTMNDGENVFFSFEILDDDRQPGDKLVLKIDADLLGDLSEAQPNADDYTVTVSFDRDAPMAPVILRNRKSKPLRGCGAQIRMLEDGYSVILRVSLSAIGVPGNTPCSLGLGVELVDADKNEKETVLRWTSNYAPGNSPFGLGQLVLLGK